MKKEDIRLGDLHRMFVGNAPWEFMVEIFLRTLFIYVVFYLLMRWLGKRMNGQLTVTEMVIMLMLGGIIAVPMQTPDRGLFQGIIVISCAFIFQRGISLWGFYSGNIEKLTQGRAKLLVKNGVINLVEMEANHISRYQLFAKLRAKEVHNLGKVKRVYMEAEGLFSILKTKEEVAGLSTLPEEDLEVGRSQKKAKGKLACKNCGSVKEAGPEQQHSDSCESCQKNEWVEAVIS